MLVIVDYGTGNLGAIQNMLKRLGVTVPIASKPVEIAAATKLIFPGVGSFDTGMQCLRERGLIPLLVRKVMQDKTPCLGVCLGAQLMMAGSEEGHETGLSWFAGKAVRFETSAENSTLKVPHMGWSEIELVKASPLFSYLPADARFYFCHSYYLQPDDANQVVATAVYGKRFAAALAVGNIVAVQFHPEKSHKFGMQLLKNFVELY